MPPPDPPADPDSGGTTPARPARARSTRGAAAPVDRADPTRAAGEPVRPASHRSRGAPPTDHAEAPPGSPPPFVPLRTERLTLRPFAPHDAPALHRLINDWEVTRTLAVVPFPYDRDMADHWIAAAARQLHEASGYHLAITGQEGDREILVGSVGLRLDRGTRIGHLGYWVGRQFWGHGVATEAAGRLVRWGIANLEIDRIEAAVATDNPASAAVLRRIGFHQTGEGTGHSVARGAVHPVWLFTATRDDIFGQADPAADALLALDAAGFGGSAFPDGSDAALPADEASPDQPAPWDLVAEAPGSAVRPAPARPKGIPPGSGVRDIPAAKPLLLVAACALIDIDGRVLLARRPEGKKMAGLWEFPGGKLDPGETPEAALIRELREELGIDVTAACLAPFAFASHAYEKFHLLMPLYLCRRWKGTPTGRENQTLAWVRPQKLTDYAMPPADKPLIPLLRDFL